MLSDIDDDSINKSRQFLKGFSALSEDISDKDAVVQIFKDANLIEEESEDD